MKLEIFVKQTLVLNMQWAGSRDLVPGDLALKVRLYLTDTGEQTSFSTFLRWGSIAYSSVLPVWPGRCEVTFPS